MRSHSLDLKNAVTLSHFFIRRAEGNIKTAIDATCGNGLDTVLLASLVGPQGRVYALDIQEKAIENTRRLLQDKDISGRVDLVSASHENISQIVKEPVQAVMFNLGYLPGGDHDIVTCSTSTIIGVESSLRLLEKGGLLTIVAYTGHNGGQEEYAALSHYLNLIPQSYADVMEASFINQANQPAVLFVVVKKE